MFLCLLLFFLSVCETKSRGLSAILDALAQESTRALIGSMEEDLCDVTSRLADMWGKPLLSWSCPQVTKGTQRLVPSLEETANAIVAVAKTLKWKTIVIITSDVGWWPVLANKIEVGLQEMGVAPRHLYWENDVQPRQALRGLQNSHARVIILCASLRSSTGETILQTIDTFGLSQTIILAIDVSTFIPYIPRILPSEVDPFKELNINDKVSYQGDDASVYQQETNKSVNDEGNGSKESEEEDRREIQKDLKVEAVSLNKNDADEAVDLSVNKTHVHDLNKLFDAKNSEVQNYSLLSIPNEAKNGILISSGIKNITRSRLTFPNDVKNLGENISQENRYRSNNHNDELHGDRGSVTLVDDDRFPVVTDGHISEHLKDSLKKGEDIVGLNSVNMDNLTSGNGQYLKIKIGNYFRDDQNDTDDLKSDVADVNSTDGLKSEFNNVGLNLNLKLVNLHKSESLNLVNDNRSNILKEFNEKYSNRQKILDTLSRKKRSWSYNRYEMFQNLSSDIKKSFVILTSMDSKNVVSDIFGEKSSKNVLFEHVMEGLKTVAAASQVNKTSKVFKFLFLDWKEETTKSSEEKLGLISRWRPLIVLQSSKNVSVNVGLHSGSTFQQGDVLLSILKLQPNFDDWFAEKGLGYEEESCDGDFCIRAQIKMNYTHIIIIVVAATLFCILCIGLALIIRNFLLKKRLSKGSNKIILTATDFVFPQVPDSRRVDEGIEAMLCCWLQQLQEFGGPEVVDKPDLLKGSTGSPRTTAGATAGTGSTAMVGVVRGPSSNGSLARNNYIVDHRIRYNGDLVQLKELPSVGTFEMKSKAMDCLVLTQGLRHENLNPFIGCLTDPARPALVHEHCSRGSLEDVLMMDEIKLDWSFRLSLLTDLVRGMRYLHSTPLKVHGYLTSRNCVIDARWVLKITDYGLPAFYEAQSMAPPAKSSRDLLWTAPELLRHCGLRRRGTQAGDVYSFGIIMQEVVVRGEPFCMLALSPEEIIEKVKKPPPLIRPSVSKGAAPPDAIHIMRQCWTEQPEMRPDFCQVHDLFRKLNHGRKVNFVDTMFQMLEKYSNNLEELIRERTEQLDMEKKKTEQLLNRMLPSYVAEKLKLGMPVDPEEFSEVSIYFSDIVGFTSISAHCTPFQVVDLLNDLYTCFDATINAYNVYKVETIGDAYMVVGGLPIRVSDHAEQVATMALDLLHQSGRFKIRHLPRTPLHLRIGLHTGPCCAGVVGLTMPRYCLFGDTVNTASRMESTGSAWRIHISQATRDKLEAAGGYSLEYRGRTEVKGKGKLPTYWLLGKAGFDKALPKPPPIGVEECIVINGLQAARAEELAAEAVTLGSVSPAPSDAAEKPHHFSIDRSFFSVETTSPLDTDQHKSVTPTVFEEQPDHPIPKSTSIDTKISLDILDTPNVSQDLPDVNNTIPVITTEISEDSQMNFDQISKAEASGSNAAGGRLQAGGHQITLGTPVSASEVAAALLGSSTSSLVSNRYKDIAKYKRSLMFEGTDLSTPYNHYRCLSPSDSNISQLNQSKISFGSGGDSRHGGGRMLKRQFSLDRADDSGNSVPEGNLASQNSVRTQPRLCKQNSAGAATDLERIEEVPLVPVLLASPKQYKRRLETVSTFPGNSKSVSTESLTTAIGQK